jgi:hypothetical protein
MRQLSLRWAFFAVLSKKCGGFVEESPCIPATAVLGEGFRELLLAQVYAIQHRTPMTYLFPVPSKITEMSKKGTHGAFVSRREQRPWLAF